MLYRLSAFIAAALLLLPPAAQTPAELAREQFEVDGMHSTIGFTAKLLGAIKVRGRFRRYDVAVTIDSAHLERSSVTAIIQSKSIDTDMDFRDEHVRSPDFLDVKTFPTIAFRSEQVAARPGGVTVTGPLTIHGVTHRVSFPATISWIPRLGRSGNIGVALEAHLKLSRADFGIAGTNKFNPDYDPATNLLSDSLEIDLEMSADHAGYLDMSMGWQTPPGVADTITKVVNAQGAAAGIATYNALVATRPKDFTFDPSQLDLVAHLLVTRGKPADALAIAKFNAEQYPLKSSVFETLGTAAAYANDRAAALAAYQRAAALEPLSATAQEMVRRLAALS